LLCRTQVRHETAGASRAAGPAEEAADSALTALEADPVGAAAHGPAEPETAVEECAVDEHRVADFDEHEDTIGMDLAALRATLPSTTEGDSLWDPLPVTLPTYVTKPKARRTVRTIDLGEPGTWTSGRTAQDATVAAETASAAISEGAAAEAGDSTPGDDHQRAVGS
jgi:hypothetical protein